MKEPDVIYVEFGEDANLAFEKQPFEETPAFIRKNALIEWAKEKNQIIDTDEGDYSLGYVSAMIDLIDKLNSM